VRTGVLKNGNETVVASIEIADRMRERTKGLLGRGGLEEGRGMLLTPCGSIHTFGMRFSLDLVFLRRDWTVHKVVRNVRPNRARWGGRRAWSVVEVGSGWLPQESVRVGDRLCLGPGRRES